MEGINIKSPGPEHILKIGTLVYRSNKSSRVEDTGNLVPKGEGPSKIMEALGDGAYTLQNRQGATLPRTWNIAELKKCYI
ncbi:hypothetical protein Tco_1226282 [Tanacetum coccineum]